MAKVSDEDRRTISYFIEKGDIERWVSWDEEKKHVVFEEIPQLEKALTGVKLAEDYLQFVLENYVRN